MTILRQLFAKPVCVIEPKASRGEAVVRLQRALKIDRSLSGSLNGEEFKIVTGFFFEWSRPVLVGKIITAGQRTVVEGYFRMLRSTQLFFACGFIFLCIWSVMVAMFFVKSPFTPEAWLFLSTGIVIGAMWYWQLRWGLQKQEIAIEALRGKMRRILEGEEYTI